MAAVLSSRMKGLKKHRKIGRLQIKRTKKIVKIFLERAALSWARAQLTAD